MEEKYNIKKLYDTYVDASKEVSGVFADCSFFKFFAKFLLLQLKIFYKRRMFWSVF